DALALRGPVARSGELDGGADRVVGLGGQAHRLILPATGSERARSRSLARARLRDRSQAAERLQSRARPGGLPRLKGPGPGARLRDTAETSVASSPNDPRRDRR